MVEASHIFLTYLIKEEVSRKRASDRSTDIRRERSRPEEPAPEPQNVRDSDRAYRPGFQYPDRFTSPNNQHPIDRERARREFAASTVEKIKRNIQIVKIGHLGKIPYLKFTNQKPDPVSCKLHANHRKLDSEPHKPKKVWFSGKDPKDVEELMTQIDIQKAMDNEEFQERNYPKACDFLGLDKAWPTVKGLRLLDENGNAGCLLPHQVIGVYWLIKKELVDGVPGLILNDFCGSGKVSIYKNPKSS